MKIRLALLLFFVFFGKDLCAQFTNNNWCWGDSAYVHWNSTGIPTLGRSSVKFRSSSTSIGNSNGVIAYSARKDAWLPVNGYVWNRFHMPMQNANLIYGSGTYHERLFLPYPGNDSLLLLFSECTLSNCPYGLFYSIIDLKANNDSGAVIQKNIPLNNYPALDALMAVQHGNGRDWWLLFQRWDGSNGNTGYNDFFVYLIDSTGVNLHTQQFVGFNHAANGGHLVFNSSGTQFVVVTLRNLIQLYDFDRCSGLITLWETVLFENSPPIIYLYPSCAFSPDNKILYVTEATNSAMPSRLLQFDLTSGNIASSKTVIYSFFDPAEGVLDLKLAPDNNIYLSAQDQSGSYIYADTFYTQINTHLSVINQPDSLGLACDFQPFSFYLGGARTYYGLPNNPDYELGAWVGSPCDTLTVSLNENGKEEDVFFQAWYNVEWNMIHVNASKLKGQGGVLQLFDVEGRVIYERKIDVIAGGYYTGEINMNVRRTADASGMYIVSLSTEKDKVQSKILKY